MASMNDSQLDEAQRRYYLDAMGIQCWQLLESQQSNSEQSLLQTSKVAEQGGAGDLHKTQQHEILARGNASADMMFVLQSPSSNDASGELCGGEEGELLTKMLAAINVSIEDVYITSLLQSSTPANHTISSDKIVQCLTHLQHQIKKVKPKVLIVLGEAAAQMLSKQKAPLDVLRETINRTNEDSKNNFESIPLFVSYSPAELLQNVENKRKAWSDLQQLQKLFLR